MYTDVHPAVDDVCEEFRNNPSGASATVVAKSGAGFNGAQIQRQTRCV